METKKGIFTRLKKSQRPEVPASYFDQFIDDLMDQIQPNHTILDGLIKSEKPDVPEGYFSQATLPIKEVTNEKREDGPLATMIKSQRPDTPANFFDHFEEGIMEKVKSEQTSRHIISLPLLFRISIVTIHKISI